MKDLDSIVLQSLASIKYALMYELELTWHPLDGICSTKTCHCSSCLEIKIFGPLIINCPIHQSQASGDGDFALVNGIVVPNAAVFRNIVSNIKEKEPGDPTKVQNWMKVGNDDWTSAVLLLVYKQMVAGGREKPQIETSLLPWPSLPHHYFESFEFCYRDLSPAGQEGVWEQQPSVLIMPLGFQFWIYFGLVGIHFNPNLRAILQSYPGKGGDNGLFEANQH